MTPILVFDIETVPDAELGRRLGFEGSDVEVCERMLAARAEETGSSFLPLEQHRVVAISSALLASALLCWALARTGRREIAAAMLIGLLWSATTIYAFESGYGMHSAVVFIYLILASQFGSFIQPVAIMMSLPMALIGVVLALILARSTLNIFSIIGFIMLMGLVTKNAILLIDFVNQERQAGKARAAAVLAAGRIRLRPILMTTLAMIFGMIPLASGLGEGGEQRAPMGQAVIGGVITSGLLTLIVVPVIYTYLDDLAAWLKRFGKLAAPSHSTTKAP